MSWSPLAVAVAAGLTAAACSSAQLEPTVAESVGGSVVTDQRAAAGRERSCDTELLGADEGEIVAIHEVVRGQLGQACYGGDDSGALAEGWQVLTELSPPQELDSIELLVAFRARPGNETVAYAGPIVETDNSSFMIAIDIEVAAADEVELQATVAHELAHVFTQEPDQLDIASSRSDCEGFHNGYGCFLPGSYLDVWTEEFWSDRSLDQLPATGQGDELGGLQRCSLDPAFLGSYAASHPEEDFAESFAAYVLAAEVDDAAEPRMAFFERYPELRAFRDRAAAAGRDELAVEFDQCG